MKNFEKEKKIITTLLVAICLTLFVDIIIYVAENYKTRTTEFTYQGKGIVKNIDGSLCVVCSEEPMLISGENSEESSIDDITFSRHSNTFEIPFSLRKKAKNMIGKEVMATFLVTQQSVPAIISSGDGASFKIMWEIKDITAVE